MTLKEAKTELVDIDGFCKKACNACGGRWQCKKDCQIIKKARSHSFDLLAKKYAKNKGDWNSIFRSVNRFKH